jgi:3-hydroxyisobutyrate dehydrogenase
MTTVAVLGTGIMGAPMARNLIKAGLDVRVWNRTRDKAEPLASDGARVCDDPADAVTGAELVVTMLLDADSVADAITGALPAMADGALWLQMTTVGVDGAARLADLAREHGVAIVDAPVLGTKQPAESGELMVLAAGPADLRDRAAPVFDAVGRATRWVGDEPGRASALKMVMNSWVLSLTDAVSETVALAQGLGFDPQLFFDGIAGTALDVGYAHLKGKAMVAEQFPPMFGLDNALKDARLIVAAGESAGVRMSLTAAVRDDLERASGLGHGAEDLGAVYYAHRAG